MTAFVHQLRTSLRLHFRNRMAIVYSYLFPTIFLIAFWVLYRHERVPLARHMGELLTVTALGGACFGLPTTMVSERERGVWRRYRLAPVPTGVLLGSTVLARYVLLILAGLLQVALAMAVGMPLPNHPIDLWVSFTFVAFALLGLGLVIATLADNVPAVQALGQCIFLPMLIIGGVAVQLASLPDWAQHVSAFFPGRYAVEAMQAAVTGGGLAAVRFSLLALFLIGTAGFLAGAKLFRWDAQQRFATQGGKGWIAVSLASWVAVGLLAEAGGYVKPGTTRAPVQAGYTPPPGPAAETPTPAPEPPEVAAPAPSLTPAPETAPTPSAEPPRESAAKPAPEHAPKPAPSVSTPESAAPKPIQPVPQPPPSAAPPEAPAPDAGTTPGSQSTAPPPEPSTWRDVTQAHIDQVMFERLPPDAGVVSPISPPSEPLDPDTEADLEDVRSRIGTWGPGRVDDPVQKVRNILYVAAVPDVFQLPAERYLPHVVFERLQQDVPKEDLIKILYWIATHPGGGDDSALDDLRGAGLKVNGPSDIDQTRERVMLYALKLLGRLVGKIPVE
jgi:outer membrane biosynthesis protein TonB/ABC-type transport system involved in cytochrome c biogenesis permease component